METARKTIPTSHQSFLKTLPYTYQTEDCFFVHAGIRPGVAFDKQSDLDLIWIRKEFIEDRRDHGKLVVHGHTATKFPEYARNRVNLDGGTGFGRPLYPGVFENGQVWVLTEKGRKRLEPVTSLTTAENPPQKTLTWL